MDSATDLLIVSLHIHSSNSFMNLLWMSCSQKLRILCMEVLSQHINQNNKIKGLSIDRENNQNVKAVQYADDTTFFLKKTHVI